MEVLTLVAQFFGGSIEQVSEAARLLLPFGVFWGIWRMEKILREIVTLDRRILIIETIITNLIGEKIDHASA